MPAEAENRLFTVTNMGTLICFIVLGTLFLAAYQPALLGLIIFIIFSLVVSDNRYISVAEITFVLIMLFILIMIIIDIINPHQRKLDPNFLNYNSKYMKEKERYEKTGRVSNWYQKGRTVYDFEIKNNKDQQHHDLKLQS
jgi:glucan phosphoethanolaminetransferase (alkaline phosphatase superfamily)